MGERKFSFVYELRIALIQLFRRWVLYPLLEIFVIGAPWTQAADRLLSLLIKVLAYAVFVCYVYECAKIAGRLCIDSWTQ